MFHINGTSTYTQYKLNLMNTSFLLNLLKTERNIVSHNFKQNRSKHAGGFGAYTVY